MCEVKDTLEKDHDTAIQLDERHTFCISKLCQVMADHINTKQNKMKRLTLTHTFSSRNISYCDSPILKSLSLLQQMLT